MKKLLFVLPAALLMTGCSLFESDKSEAVTPNEPIKVEMEITERSAAPVEEAAPKAEKPAKKKKTQAAAPASASQKRVELPPEMSGKTSFDDELNDVERGYMDSIRRNNRKSREESSRNVFFGGWNL